MQGIKRKVVHAVLFEILAVLSTTIIFMAATDHGVGRSGSLALVTSLVALLWNMLYNTAFERWEARQTRRGRSLLRRATHTLGFEAGLVLLLLPPIAWWLEISVGLALSLEAGMVVYFLIYGFVYNWCFDHLFGLPDSARHAAKS